MNNPLVKNLTFRTSLTKQEIFDLLQLNVESEINPFGPIFGKKNTKTYGGSLSFDSFKIQNIQSFNSFRPMIIGTINSESDESIIQVKMQLFSVVIIFLIFFFFFGLLMSGLFFWTIDEFNWIVLAPLGGIIFAVIFAIGNFETECRDSINDFEYLFKCK